MTQSRKKMEKPKRRPSRPKRAFLVVLAGLGIVAVLIFVNQLPTLYAQFRDYHTPVWGDNSLITQQPCALPCWHGLQVGVSTHTDVEAFLYDNPNIPDWSLDFQESRNEAVGWSRPYAGGYGKFWFQGTKILHGIFLAPAHPIFIRDVMAVYGEPTATQLIFTYPKDVPLERYGLFGIFLYYPQYGLFIESHFEPEEKDGEMNFRVPDNPIIFSYSISQPKNDLTEFLPGNLSGLTKQELDEALKRQHIVPGWVGFGRMIEP
jgi:hypothetical protein